MNESEMPTMKGDARVARGASYFEVPLFSHVKDNLWQGCSPAEFPQELEESNFPDYSYEQMMLIRSIMNRPINCKWLMKWDPILLRNEPRFDAILNLYQWGDYVVPEGTEQLTVEMYDSLSELSDQIEELAETVVGWLNKGKKVLIHCQAGLNRSSLLTARVLMIKYKMKAQEAINLIRDQRSPMCLCNDSFVDYLLSFDKSPVSVS